MGKKYKFVPLEEDRLLLGNRTNISEDDFDMSRVDPDPDDDGDVEEPYKLPDHPIRVYNHRLKKFVEMPAKEGLEYYHNVLKYGFNYNELEHKKNGDD